MTIQSILLPVFVQIGLTFFIAFWMAKQRWGVMLRGEMRWQDIALKQRPWPARTQQVSNCFQNQFEVPVLFYVLVALAILTKKADLLFVVMAWLFVLTRIAHAFVFTTSNYVPRRGQIFVAGALVVFLMWVIFAIRILLSPSFATL
jgi:hypothetical protein